MSESQDVAIGSVPSTVDAITLFVADPQRSKPFYEDVFGQPPVFEDKNSVAFRFKGLLLNLLTLPAARDLIEPGTVADGESGARFQLTVGVDNTDAVCARLASRGIKLLNGPIDRPWRVRTASFADPDGHIWEVAEELPRR